MHIEDALALYCAHRLWGEHPGAFFRRAVLETHPDKVTVPKKGLPTPQAVLEARAAWRSYPIFFEQAAARHTTSIPSYNRANNEFEGMFWRSRHQHQQQQTPSSPPTEDKKQKVNEEKTVYNDKQQGKTRFYCPQWLSMFSKLIIVIVMCASFIFVGNNYGGVVFDEKTPSGDNTTKSQRRSDTPPRPPTRKKWNQHSSAPWMFG